ncbi:NAD(P)/FAD-dependent oxidoreductase [Candidatus Micrarchaeota archaeon]|nr:NAD(P)/FAD-dependent oxidoreductase [Candidatus Micrarchaeota archaeon]
MKTECLVVGASVVGGVAAKELARRGFDTVLLSDKPHVGKDGKCTSIISASGLARTGIRFHEALVHEIFGANIRCRKTCLTVRRPEPVAHVLDRFRLDQLSVEQAQDAGAELKTSARFENWDAATRTAQTAAGPIQTDYLVGADGIASNVARQCGFPALEHFVVAWEGEFEKASLNEPDVVDVFLDIPGLFGWAVPAGENTVRVGLATKTAAQLKTHKTRLQQEPVIHAMLHDAKKVREFHHTIPLHYRRQTQKDNVLLVGDAAGQVKATTGGGIVFGALCAQELAGACQAHRDGGKLDYETRWRAKYAGALDGHRRIRSLMDALPPRLMSFGIDALTAIGGQRFLENKGDMDFILQ